MGQTTPPKAQAAPLQAEFPHSLQEFRDTALNDAQPESTSPIDFPIPKMDFVMDRLDLWRGHLYGAVCGRALD
jgi:hypothetical protein